MTWPHGPSGSLRFDARGHDADTGPGGSSELRSASRVVVETDADRIVLEVTAEPPLPALAALTGVAVAGGFRARAGGLLDGASALVAQLVDDLPGCGIIADFALRQWRGVLGDLPLLDVRGGRPVVGVCMAFAEGSTALAPDGSSTGAHRTTDVGPLGTADDADAWHEMPADDGRMSMRRARRADVVRVGDRLRVDAFFQDSSTTPRGGRRAVHEYRISLEVDAGSREVLSAEASAGNLPYAECPAAAAGVDVLLGTRLDDVPSVVRRQLRGTAGCTHLNDALRALGGVPALAAGLVGGSGPPSRPWPAGTAPSGC